MLEDDHSMQRHLDLKISAHFWSHWSRLVIKLTIFADQKYSRHIRKREFAYKTITEKQFGKQRKRVLSDRGSQCAKLDILTMQCYLWWVWRSWCTSCWTAPRSSRRSRACHPGRWTSGLKHINIYYMWSQLWSHNKLIWSSLVLDQVFTLLQPNLLAHFLTMFFSHFFDIRILIPD